jgi:7-cyano-7-deazaguanine reductase
MTLSIEQIASKHLGKAGDGTIVKPYITPTVIDKSLLVAVPRILNRVQYNIEDANLPFYGFDVWNSYEFSALTDNGFPVTGHLKIVYPADSECIVESKSLKLYLNSFNMCRLGTNVNEVRENSTKIIQDDLSSLLNTRLTAKIFINDEEIWSPREPVTGIFKNLDSINIEGVQFDKYNEDPELLRSCSVDRKVSLYVHSSNLRSNCRVTNQPDWGDVYIYMTSKYEIDETSVLQYLVSMRNENHFHEEICECIYKRFWDFFNPENLLVTCLYTRRGGIDINPVRASSENLMHIFTRHLVDANFYTSKTWRQ